MAYQKPTCDCGSELIYSTEIVYLTRKKINKNGRLSKNKELISMYEYGVYSSNGIEVEKLVCTNTDCFNTYVCEYDDKNRVIRGEEI